MPLLFVLDNKDRMETKKVANKNARQKMGIFKTI
jgi:hypothetical protein